MYRIIITIASRWQILNGSAERDRGDSPVPTVIIWVGIAAVAVTLIAWATGLVNSIIATAPTAP